MRLYNTYISIEDPMKPDKGWPHPYLYLYDILLEPWVDKPINFVEFGVAGGQSMVLWDRFFTHPNTRIYGIDRNLGQCPEFVRKSLSNRVILVESPIGKASSTIIGSLDKVHVALDDGGHGFDTQQPFFELIRPKLVDGGLHIIEDIQSVKAAKELLKLDPKMFVVDMSNIHKFTSAKDDRIVVLHNIPRHDMWNNYSTNKPTKIFIDEDN